MAHGTQIVNTLTVEDDAVFYVVCSENSKKAVYVPYRSILSVVYTEKEDEHPVLALRLGDGTAITHKSPAAGEHAYRVL